MGVIGDMQKFQQYQMGQAMTMAAENPAGGGAAEGMGLGVGLAMASRMMPGQMTGQGAATAPPPPPSVLWYLAVNGQTKGPFTTEQMAAGIASSEVKSDSVVWFAGMQTWTPAAQVPQLAGYFAAVTPPPPPPAP